MALDRRQFLRFVGSSFALLSKRAPAELLSVSPAIHTETRNTRFGAVGRRYPREGSSPPFKRHPDKPFTALPTLEPVDSRLADVLASYRTGRALAPGELSLRELADLLYLGNGITGRKPSGDRFVRLRAAPSAGALYAGELYVVVERVRGLDPGLYYYEVPRHRLVKLVTGSRRVELEAALERPGTITNASATILLSNVFGRYTRQYANRGYRYALIDSGHIGENLRLAASAAGLADASPLRFCDARLNGMLGLDASEEAVCALHAIGRPGASGVAAPARVRNFDEQQRVGAAATEGRVTERYHLATALVPAGNPPSGEEPSLGPSAEPGQRLPETPTTRMSVASAIRQRRSAGGFTTDSISLRELSFVLMAAGRNDGLRRAAGVDVFTVAHRVTGLAPGVYRSDGAFRQLVPVRIGDVADAMVRACVRQEMAGSAAAGFVMAARLGGSASQLGDRRYRDLLIESGAIAQRIYLAAEALDLGARNLAAFQDDRFNGLLGLDASHHHALHLTMLGRPVTGSS